MLLPVLIDSTGVVGIIVTVVVVIFSFLVFVVSRIKKMSFR